MSARRRLVDPAIPIRILLIEDSDIDADLISIHLRNVRLPFELKRVDHRSDYAAALHQERFDIILADYSLPDFNGLEALHLAQENHADVPFIFVSGVVGEDFATGALKEGATDYVLKRTLDRLPGAVERAVAEARERDYRQRAEGALRRSEVSVRLAVEAAKLGMWAYYPQSGELTWDSRCRALYGLDLDQEVDYELFLSGIHPDDRERMALAVETVITANVPMEFKEEYRIITPEGGERWLLTRGQSFLEAGRCTRFLGVLQDITEQKQAAAALVRMNESLEATIEERTRERDRTWQLSRDLMLVGRLDRPPLALNPAWTETLGWPMEELMRGGVDRFVHEEDRERTRAEVQRAMRGLPSRPFENRVRHKDGSLRWIAWSVVASDGVLHAVGRDVTQERTAQEQLRQAQKMETIGQLTGGVAHDFNNLLTVIAGNLETVQRYATHVPDELGGARIRHSATNAMRGAERAAALTQRLLAFARRQPLNPQSVDVNRLIEGMSDLLRRTLGEHIAIETLLGENLWYSHVDLNQLEIAVLNLAVNARDAMEGGGRLTIETANTRLDELYAASHDEVAAGAYVVVAVTDTGSGMTPDVLAQAFEPFFTTKDVGHGTGLGLSQVYGFVKQSGGHVKIYTEPGQGTTVKLYLPRHRDNAEADHASSPDTAPPAGSTAETILVVEDDDDVRRYSTELLRELGYHCLVAPNGRAALRILESDVNVTLLFTDVGLPGGINGRQLADAARRIRPGLKTLFTTGYAKDAIVHGGRVDPGIELITKPFTYRALAAKVRGIIDQLQSKKRVLIVEADTFIRGLTMDVLHEAGYLAETVGSDGDAMNLLRTDGAIDALVLDPRLSDGGDRDIVRKLRETKGDLPILVASGYDVDSVRAHFGSYERLLVIPKPYARGTLLQALSQLLEAP